MRLVAAIANKMSKPEMTSISVAFIETETGWSPCHVRDIKSGQTYYVVKDGVKGDIYTALSDAKSNGTHEGEPTWYIESKPVE